MTNHQFQKIGYQLIQISGIVKTHNIFHCEGYFARIQNIYQVSNCFYHATSQPVIMFRISTK